VRILSALDLFCGAGGASAGLVLANYSVTGVDKVRQRRYPYELVVADAMDILQDADYLRQFDLVWASPPCQPYSKLATLGHHWCTDELIPEVRKLLIRAGVNYVIENVPGAPLEDPILLCGTMFQLRTYRHRLFEFSSLIRPRIRQPVHVRHMVKSQLCSINRYDPNLFVSVYGKAGNAALAREILEVPWMTGAEASQCIPPCYARWCGERVRAVLRA
jgi:DNA (cytosine-5)-methyltransferase 1